ncbi:hypothetical protein FOXYSP1_12317 [Fusarium oxysporum f. sp. phaseoli]
MAHLISFSFSLLWLPVPDQFPSGWLQELKARLFLSSVQSAAGTLSLTVSPAASFFPSPNCVHPPPSLILLLLLLSVNSFSLLSKTTIPPFCDYCFVALPASSPFI